MNKQEIQEQIDRLTARLKNETDSSRYEKLWNTRLDLMDKLKEIEEV
jgi:hypothetical protein